MRIKLWFVKKVLGNRLTSILCLVFAVPLFSFDVYYTLSIYKITEYTILMTFIAGIISYLGESSSFYRMKVR